MSYKHYPYCVNAKRNQKDRKRKDCICGGHSTKDVKKNKHHHSTLMRSYHKIERKFKLNWRKELIMDEKIKIYVWPDNSWESEEEIEDLDWYISSMGKSDDYAIYEVPLELEADDIDELIELQALEGMLTNEPKIEEMGKIKVPKDAILIVTHSEDILYNAVTILENRMIISAPDLTIEIIQGKKKNEKT